MGGGSAVGNGWRVLISVFSAIAADFFPVKQGLEAIGKSAAFSAAYRARQNEGVPQDFSVEVGNVTLSRYVHPTPPPTTDSEISTSTIIVSVCSAAVVVLLATLFRIQKRRTLATNLKSNAASSGGAAGVELGHVVHNPGVDRDSDSGYGDCEISMQATRAGAKAAIGGAALVAGLTLVSHAPVIGGIATLAIQLKKVYDNQGIGGPDGYATMSKWAGDLSTVVDQLPKDLNSTAEPILDDVHALLSEMLAAAESHDQQNKLHQWVSSTRCREQQQTAQAKLHRLLSALQLGVAGKTLALQLQQMDVALGIDTKVDALLQQSQRRNEQEERQHVRDRAASAFSIPRADLQLQLDEVLGRGGGGIVYKATYHGEEVAAKVVDLHGLPIMARGVVLDNVHREVTLMTRLHSPRIVRIIGICECADEQELIVIMTLARGGSLRQQLDAAADSGAPLDVQRAIKQMHDAAVGMAFLHSKSVLHRDVKSANLLLDENGRVLVSDFGISKQSSNATTTMGAGGGGSVKGSAPWMAPEAHEGEPTTAAGDVFGFAVVMWEIMSRQTPWEGKQLSQIVRFVCDKPAPHNRPPLEAVGASFPAPLLALVQECWAQDPAARPSFADAARRLGAL